MSAREDRPFWGRALIAILLSFGLLVFGRGKPAPAGIQLELATTIVANDASDLDCDSSASLNGHRCAFTKGRRLPDVQRALRPFVTVEGEVVLLSGLFEDAKVSEFVATARRRRSDERVRVDCRSAYLGVVDKVGVHWRKDDPFEARENVRAARAEKCAISKQR